MSSIQSLFEKELKNKLALKASGHQSEETVLLKAFKYFDLDNSGECSRDEFQKAIAKIGISGFTDKNINELFDLYDVERNESLSYKELVGAIFSNNSLSRGNENQNQQRNQGGSARKHVEGSGFAFLDQEDVQAVIGKIREKLIGRGVRGIISIGKAFKIMDDNNSRTLDFNEFKKACRDYRWELNDREVSLAFKAFNRGGEGEIDYEEFLRTIRGEMNDFRIRLCKQAFRKIDRDGSGVLTIDDIRGVYNAKMHPEVKAGRKTEDDVFMEYLDTFEAHHAMMAGGEGRNSEITLDEWIEYYQNVSMSIDDDKYFELMMNNCWRMNEHTTGNNEKRGWSNKEESPNKQQSVSNAYNQRSAGTRVGSAHAAGARVGSAHGRQMQQNQQEERPQTASKSNSAIDKFRSKLLSRGARGIIGISRQFKIFDDDNSKTIDFEEFKKAVKDFRVDLTPNEIKVVFGVFDRDGQGSIDYEEFLRQIRGEMNDRRKKIALQAFDKMDKDGSGVLEINDIKYIYNAKQHPDVRAGKKSEEEIFGEFLETFETHHNIQKGNRDRRVTKEEWIEYYNNVSMSIDDDAYFETMMINAWKLNGAVNYAKGWAGDYSDNNNRNAGANNNRKVYQNAPFGVSEEKTNYSTSNRQNQPNKKNNFSEKGDEVLIRFREKISARGTRGIFGIRRSFMIADDNHSKSIDVNEFAKLIKDYRYELSQADMKKLFGLFDTNNSGDVDYEEFLRTIIGEMNDFRKGLAKRAFAKMDKNNSGSLDLNDIKGVYNAKHHPDVKAGKKTEDEVLAEFLDTFEYHFSLLNAGGTKDGVITLEEWFEYYNNISMSIDDDKYFEVMMNSTWNLDGSRNPVGKAWKGEY